MRLLPSLICLIIILVLFITKKHDKVFYIVLASFFGDLFSITITSPALHISNFVGLLAIPYYFFYIIKSPLLHRFPSARLPILEYLLILLTGIVFGFIIPWEDETGLRSWNQLSDGRTVVQWIRIASEISLLFYLAYIIPVYNISMEKTIKLICLFSIVHVLFGIVSFYTDNSLKDIFFYQREDLLNRFTGFFGEPKAYGRTSALIVLFLTSGYFAGYKKPVLLIATILNITAVFISLSASSIVLLLMGLFLLSILFTKTILKYSLPIYILILIASFLFFNTVKENSFFEARTTLKIEKVLLGTETEGSFSSNEPFFFTRFDIFDRAALNFLYDNPIYFFTGTGPNLISIPASDYIPASSIFAVEERIDSVPNVMINNLLARTGILGVLCYVLFFIKGYKSLESNVLLKSWFLLSFLFAMVIFNTMFYLFIGIILGQNFIEMLNKNEIDKRETTY